MRIFHTCTIIVQYNMFRVRTGTCYLYKYKYIAFRLYDLVVVVYMIRCNDTNKAVVGRAGQGNLILKLQPDPLLSPSLSLFTVLLTKDTTILFTNEYHGRSPTQTRLVRQPLCSGISLILSG